MNTLPELTRRGFLKVTGTAMAAATLPRGVTLFMEPIAQPVQVPQQGGFTLTDMGDYVMLHVLSNSRAANLSITKPLLLLLENNSSFEDSYVDGFINIAAQTDWLVTGICADSKFMRSIDNPERPLVTVLKGQHGDIKNCIFNN